MARYIFLSDIENAHIIYEKRREALDIQLLTRRCRKRCCPCISTPCYKKRDAMEEALKEYEDLLEEFAENSGIPEEKRSGIREKFETYHRMQREEEKRHQEERKRIMCRFYKDAGVQQEADE